MLASKICVILFIVTFSDIYGWPVFIGGGKWTVTFLTTSHLKFSYLL